MHWQKLFYVLKMKQNLIYHCVALCHRRKVHKMQKNPQNFTIMYISKLKTIKIEF